MTVGIVRLNWSGASGGPGLSQFAIAAAGGTAWATADASSATSAVRNLAAAMALYIPDDIRLDVSRNVDLYDQVSGKLTGSVTAGSTPAQVVGQSASAFLAGAGFKTDWNTGVVLGGRRVVGKTYWVPAVGSAFDTDGTLLAATITNINTALSTFLSSLSTANLGMQVWHRPGAKSAPAGTMVAVNSGSVKDRSAFLRNRRD